MSRKSTREYILRKQEDYIGELNRLRKGKVLDEVCAVTGLERKYASKLLSGARAYHVRKRRGKAHGAGAEKLLEQAWNGAGCPNEKYLKVVIGKVLKDLGELQNVRGDEAAEDRRRGTARGGLERRLARGVDLFVEDAAVRREGEQAGHDAAHVVVAEIAADQAPLRQADERLRAGDRRHAVARLEHEAVQKAAGKAFGGPAGLARVGAEGGEDPAVPAEGGVRLDDGPEIGEGGGDVAVGFVHAVFFLDCPGTWNATIHH